MTTRFLTILMMGLMFSLVACEENEPASVDTPEGNTETTETGTTTVPATPTASAAVLVVLNDTIASPLKQLSGTIDGVEVTVTYGSPAAKGRALWGELVPYAEVWRTGANEATTIEFSGDVMIEDQPLAAGKYSLFTIPGENDWTLIFNTVSDQWGAYQYEEAKDALRAKVISGAAPATSETLDFAMEGNQVTFMWGDLAVPFTIAKG